MISKEGKLAHVDILYYIMTLTVKLFKEYDVFNVRISIMYGNKVDE